MKEREIKERIAKFLRQTAKAVVLPAAMGLGLGLGCGGDRAVEVPNDGGTQAEAALPHPAYAAPYPQPEYAAPFPEPDSSVVAKYAAPFPEPPGPQPDYAAPFPEPEPSDAGPANDVIENGLLYGTPFPPPSPAPDGSAP